MDTVHHREIGKGYPLILIHGFCETNEIWTHLADKLALKFRIIMPDLPGFGSSRFPADPFTLDDIGRTMLDWADRWRGDRPVIIGHSLGGYVTLSMISQQPSGFAGFGLFHSTAYADSEEKKENRNKVIDFVQRHGVEPFIDTFVPGLFHQKENRAIPDVHRIAAQTSAATLLAYSVAMRDRHSYKKLLESFSKPILFVAGEQDTVVPFRQLLEQSQSVRFPVFHRLADTGHMGMLEQGPASVKIVEDFTNFSIGFKANERYLS